MYHKSPKLSEYDGTFKPDYAATQNRTKNSRQSIA